MLKIRMAGVNICKHQREPFVDAGKKIVEFVKNIAWPGVGGLSLCIIAGSSVHLGRLS